MTLHYLDNYTDNYFRYFYMRVLFPGVLSYLFLWYFFIFMISFHICGIFSYIYSISYKFHFLHFLSILPLTYNMLFLFNLSNPKAFISSLTKVRWIKFSASLLVHNRIIEFPSSRGYCLRKSHSFPLPIDGKDGRLHVPYGW